MSDERLEVLFGANTQALVEGFTKATAEVRRFREQVEGELGGIRESVTTLTESFTGIAEVVGAAKAFEVLKEGAEKAADAVIESVKANLELSESFERLEYETGMSSAQLVQLDAAAALSGQGLDLMQGLVRGATRALSQHEDEIRKNGVATRDAQGNLVPFADYLQEVSRRADQMAPGLDRNQFLMTALGRAGVEAGPGLHRLVEEMEAGKEAAARYGLEVGEGDIRNMQAFQRAQGDMKVALQATEMAIGRELIPVVVELAGDLKDDLPAAVDFVRDAFLGFHIMVENGRAVVKEYAAETEQSWETIKDAVSTSVREVEESLVGEYKLMAEEGESFLERTRMRGNLLVAYETSVEAERTAAIQKAVEDRLKLHQQEDSASTGGDRFKGKGKGDKDQVFADAQKEWEMMRALVVSEGGKLADIDDDMEYAFWASKLDIAEQGSDSWAKIQLKLGELQKRSDDEAAASDQRRAAAAAKLAQVQKQVQDLVAQDEEAAAKSSLALQRARLDAEVQAGDLSGQQRLAQLRQLREEELQVELDALAKKMALAEGNVVEQQRLANQVAAVKRAAAMQEAQDEIQAQKESEARWKGWAAQVGSTFSGLVQDLITRQRTWQQDLGALLMRSLGDFVDMEVRTLAQHEAVELQKRFASHATLAAQTADQTAASAEALTSSKVQATSEINANAGVAAVAAMGSVAAIPVSGWAMAPEVGASVYAEGLGYLGSVASAEGGWDIPAGISPLARLHEREMVLPRAQADVVRGLAQDGPAAQMRPVFQVQAVDARGVEDFFRTHGRQVARSLAVAARAWSGGQR